MTSKPWGAGTCMSLRARRGGRCGEKGTACRAPTNEGRIYLGGPWTTRLLTAGGSCSKMLLRSWGRLHLPAVFTFLEAGGGRIRCLQAR